MLSFWAFSPFNFLKYLRKIRFGKMKLAWCSVVRECFRMKSEEKCPQAQNKLLCAHRQRRNTSKRGGKSRVSAPRWPQTNWGNAIHITKFKKLGNPAEKPSNRIVQPCGGFHDDNIVVRGGLSIEKCAENLTTAGGKTAWMWPQMNMQKSENRKTRPRHELFNIRDFVCPLLGIDSPLAKIYYCSLKRQA